MASARATLELGTTFLADVLRQTGRRLVRGPGRPGWSWRAEIARTVMYRTLMRSKRRGVPWLREVQALTTGPSPHRARCRSETAVVGGVPCEWWEPQDPGAERTLVYFHGGGYVIGSVAVYRETLARLAVCARARVLGVDYRLAPEHPFPAAQDDCLSATRAVLAGTPAREVALAGDSAGGALAVATLCALRDAGEPLPAAAALLCPWVDPMAAGGSMDAHVRFDFGDRELLVGWAEQALAGASASDPRFSVLGAKLEGLPPLLVQVGGAEVLLDQVRAFAQRARAAGVDVRLDEAPDMFHVWQLQAALLPEGAAAMDALATYLRERVAPSA